MMVSKVPLSRCEELSLVATCELCPTLAVSDSSVPSADLGRVAVIAAVVGHLWLRPADFVAASHLGFHRNERCSFDVVDTFPERCRRQSVPLR